MQKILTKAAMAGAATVKTIWSNPRDEIFYFYPGKSQWLNPFPGGEYTWVKKDAQFPGIDNKQAGMIKNTDGSYDIFFGPKAPKGQENNWIQTVPGKSWSVIFRLDGPLEAWYNKT